MLNQSGILGLSGLGGRAGVLIQLVQLCGGGKISLALLLRWHVGAGL